MSRLRKAIEFETTFGCYVASEIIGEGGTGKVYKTESDAGQIVAVKVLDPAKASSTERRGRFKSELLFGTRNQHPNIVTVIDHGPLRVGSSIAPFYVMPLYESSLRDAIQKGVPPASALIHYVERKKKEQRDEQKASAPSDRTGDTRARTSSSCPEQCEDLTRLCGCERSPSTPLGHGTGAWHLA